MSVRKYRRYFSEYEKYTISNVPNVDFDVDVPLEEGFDVPPVRLYYTTLFGVETALNESFYDYCEFSMPDSIWNRERLEFFIQNLIPILCGKIEGWRFIGTEITSYTTSLYFISKQYHEFYYVTLTPHAKKLRLLFKTEDSAGNVVKHFYSLCKELPLGRYFYAGRKTQLKSQYSTGAYRKFQFSEMKRYIHEWLTGQDCYPVDIIERN